MGKLMFASSQRSCILLSEEFNPFPGLKKCETSTGILGKGKKKGFMGCCSSVRALWAQRVTWISCAVLSKKKKKKNLRVNYLFGCMKSPKLWTACRDREPFGCGAQLVSFSAWIISPPHAKHWQSKCQRLKYLPRKKNKKWSNEMCWAKGQSLRSCIAVPTDRFLLVPQTWCVWNSGVL